MDTVGKGAEGEGVDMRFYYDWSHPPICVGFCCFVSDSAFAVISIFNAGVCMLHIFFLL